MCVEIITINYINNILYSDYDILSSLHFPEGCLNHGAVPIAAEWSGKILREIPSFWLENKEKIFL